MKNSLFTIFPYQVGNALVFDDPVVGLVREPFVEGADTALELAARAAGADPAKFTLIFSATYFPSHQAIATWTEKGEQESGDWYLVDLGSLGKHEAWLCPALLLYFDKPPAQIFFQIKPNGVPHDDVSNKNIEKGE